MNSPERAGDSTPGQEQLQAFVDDVKLIAAHGEELREEQTIIRAYSHTFSEGKAARVGITELPYHPSKFLFEEYGEEVDSSTVTQYELEVSEAAFDEEGRGTKSVKQFDVIDGKPLQRIEDDYVYTTTDFGKTWKRQKNPVEEAVAAAGEARASAISDEEGFQEAIAEATSLCAGRLEMDEIVGGGIYSADRYLGMMATLNAIKNSLDIRDD
jgi:hypothetical protein